MPVRLGGQPTGRGGTRVSGSALLSKCCCWEASLQAEVQLTCQAQLCYSNAVAGRPAYRQRCSWGVRFSVVIATLLLGGQPTGGGWSRGVQAQLCFGAAAGRPAYRQRCSWSVSFGSALATWSLGGQFHRKRWNWGVRLSKNCYLKAVAGRASPQALIWLAAVRWRTAAGRVCCSRVMCASRAPI